MEGRYNKALVAVTTFVEDLWDAFGVKTEVSPLALYNRLLTSHLNSDDKEAVNKCLMNFRQFVVIHNDNLVDDNLDGIPKNARIPYGDSKKVYIEIGLFIADSDEDTKAVIRQHLLTISTILEPDNKKMAALESKIEELKIDTSTKEGKFVGDILEKAGKTMSQLSLSDNQNPASAMAGLMQSGILADLTLGLQQGVGSGEMDIAKLFESMQGAMGVFTNQDMSKTIVKDR